jgi:tol-pal system protein YbgF
MVRPAVVAAAVLLATDLQAADREHQQLLADLRMLQAQTQQLQVALSALAEALTVVTTRIGDQADTSRKAFADQKLLIDSLSGDVRVVREKLDENTVRVSSLSQEVDAMRGSVHAVQLSTQQIVAAQAAAAAAAATEAGGPDGAQPAAPAVAAPGPTIPEPASTPTATELAVPSAPAPPPVAPLPATFGLSPQRMYDSAYADFASGQWSLAILGFEQYIKAFPRTEQADDAQLYIGESHYLDGKFELAIQAYDRVIADYPGGDAAPMAYFKRGLPLARLGQADRARETWEAVIAKYPDSDASRLAKQSLDRLDRPNRE